MTKIILHGALAKAVGRAVWHLDVETPAEALRAIEANTNRLVKHLAENVKSHYQVLIDTNPSDVFHLVSPIRPKQTIEFVPVVAGAADDNSGTILLIIGIVLLAVVSFGTLSAMGGFAGIGAIEGGGTAAFFASATTGFSGFLATLGLAFVVAGIGQMMLGSNAKSESKERPDNKPSYIFDRPRNTYRQGNPVPLIYGKVRVGSQVISLGVRSYDLLPLT